MKFERHNQNNNNKKERNTSSNVTITNNSVTIMDGTNIASGTIPVGIAVARQRLQETAQATSPILKPDISRYGIGLGDLTGAFFFYLLLFS